MQANKSFTKSLEKKRKQKLIKPKIFNFNNLF